MIWFCLLVCICNEHHFDLKHRKLSTAALPTWFRIREMVSGVPNASLVELGKKLLSAARSGDKAEVGRLLAKGAPITSDWLGTSPLHLAAQYGHADTAEVLLRLRAFITFLACEKRRGGKLFFRFCSIRLSLCCVSSSHFY